jgi:hypothetical protein
MSSGTFAAFSKFHLNTPKSPNMKVVHFFEGHNFHVGWHFKFWVEEGGKLGELLVAPVHWHRVAFKVWLQFIKNRWEKHRSTFTKNTLLSVLYNFRIQSSVGFYSKFWRFSRSNRGTVKRSTPGRDVTRARRARAAPPRRPSRPRLSEAARLPRSRTFPRFPRSETPWSPPATRLPAARAGPRAPRIAPSSGPSVAPSPPCTPTKAAAVPRPDLRHPSSRASEAAYLSVALPPRARLCPLAPIETHPTAVVPTPRRGSRSRGWHRTASRSTAAGCPSVSTPAANRPRVISHTSLTSFPADPATGAARFRRTAAPPRPGTQLLALFTF